MASPPRNSDLDASHTGLPERATRRYRIRNCQLQLAALLPG
jgi:hypothetical protein